MQKSEKSEKNHENNFPEFPEKLPKKILQKSPYELPITSIFRLFSLRGRACFLNK